MNTKTTHQANTNRRTFMNVWIVTLSLLVGVAVIAAAVFVGYPIFMNLLERFTG